MHPNFYLYFTYTVIVLQIERTFTEKEVEQFGRLIGDLNPIHIGIDGKEKENHKIIVHGMLTASLFSSIFGTLIPGEFYQFAIYSTG